VTECARHGCPQIGFSEVIATGPSKARLVMCFQCATESVESGMFSMAEFTDFQKSLMAKKPVAESPVASAVSQTVKIGDIEGAESFGFNTSLPRSKASTPITHWRKMGLLSGDVLDFGCGKETHEFYKFDPFMSPDYSLLRRDWDVVMCNYVLNVQPSDHLIHEICALLSRLSPLVLIAVLTDSKLSGQRSVGGRDAKSRDEWEGILGEWFKLKSGVGSFCGFVAESKDIQQGSGGSK
jgi:hypothetical protein